jgi:hypothetical protein
MEVQPPYEFPPNDFHANLPSLKNEGFPETKSQISNSTIDLNTRQRETMASMKKELGEFYYNWQVGKDKEFQFGLPDSQFQLDSKMDIIEFQLPNMHEVCERSKLSKAQLDSIWETGQFEVPSSLENINHVWKLSPFLISGSKHRLGIFRTIFAAGLFLLYKKPHFFGKPKLKERLNFPTFQINLWSGVLWLFSFVLNIFDLFFGGRTIVCNQDFDSAVCVEVERKRCQALLARSFPDTTLIAQFLQKIPTDTSQDYLDKSQASIKTAQKELEKQNKKIENQRQLIEKTYNLLYKQWVDFYESSVEKFEDVEEEQFAELQQNLNSQKYQKMLTFLEKSKKIEPELHHALVQKLKAFSIIEFEQHNRNKELESEKKQIDKELKEKSPYRSKIGFWYQEQFRVRELIAETRLTAIMHDNILNSLRLEQNSENADLYQLSIETEASIEMKKGEVEAAVEKKISMPDIQIVVYRRIYPPYEVKVEDGPNKPFYSLNYYTSRTITSEYPFFRIWADLVRFAYWSIDLTYYSFRYALSGNFGLKGLLYGSTYYRDYSINYETGQVSNDRDKVNPIFMKLRNTISGIQKSRQDFEESPDTGFFGKNVARIMNLFECYVIRFLLVGVVILIVIHPVINVIVTLCCIFVSLTSAVWVFIFIISRNLFRYLIFDFESLHLQTLRYQNQVRGFFNSLKHPRSVFPLFRLIFDLLYLGVFRVLLTIFLTIIYVILAIAIFLFSFVSYYLKLVYDFLVFNILIKCFAKVPQRDTNIAKRIAGPGISRNLFCNLSIEDAVILIQSLLEKIQLKKYQSQVETIIRTPSTVYKNMVQGLVGPFLASYDQTTYAGTDKLNNTANRLVQSLSKQVDERLVMLPALSRERGGFKIKFFDEELESIKQICLRILKNNMKELKIDDYIWKYSNISQGKFQLLMGFILKQAFNSNTIFESIELADQQIVLKSDDASSLQKKSRIVNRIIEGEVKLTTFHHTYKPKKPKDAVFIAETSLLDVCNAFAYDSCFGKFIKHVYFNVHVKNEAANA